MRCRDSLNLLSAYCPARYPAPSTPAPIAKLARFRRSHLLVPCIISRSESSRVESCLVKSCAGRRLAIECRWACQWLGVWWVQRWLRMPVYDICVANTCLKRERKREKEVAGDGLGVDAGDDAMVDQACPASFGSRQHVQPRFPFGQTIPLPCSTTSPLTDPPQINTNLSVPSDRTLDLIAI
jgi:hypothetical protein